VLSRSYLLFIDGKKLLAPIKSVISEIICPESSQTQASIAQGKALES